MANRPISEVEEHIDNSIRQEIEELNVMYGTLNEAIENTSSIDELESYLDYSIEDLIEQSLIPIHCNIGVSRTNS